MANKKEVDREIRGLEQARYPEQGISSDTEIPLNSPIYLTAEQFISMVREMRRDPEQEKLKEEERKRMETRRNTRVRLAEIEIRKRETLQSRCTHMKGEPGREEPVLGGQVFSDGIERKICLRCQKIVIEIQAPELSAATDLVRGRLIKKAKELGIDADVMEELFNGTVPQNQSIAPFSVT